MDEVETVVDELRSEGFEGHADLVETQADLLKSLGEFVAQYREEFEENLSYEQQEQYREYFGLEHSTLGEALGDDQD